MAEVDKSAESGARRPLRLIEPGMRPSLPSHPPSEPRPIPNRPGADAGSDKPVRAQLIAALLLLLVLVVVPLYLWRRPRAAATDEGAASASAAPVASAAPEATASAEPKEHTKDGLTVADPRMVGCHDRGPKQTAAAACDRLPGLEAAATKAVLDASGCVPAGTPAGAIAFVIDASYGRHRAPIRVSHAREATTMPPRVVTECVAEVKKGLSGVVLDPTHSHARYEVEVDATYVGKR